MLIYLVPPLAGIILARRQRFSFFSLLLVIAGLLFTLFYGFTSGTRNVLASYLVTLLIGYAFAVGRAAPARDAHPGRHLRAGDGHRHARDAGLSHCRHQVLAINRNTRRRREDKGQTVFVDYNLLAICEIMDVFPAQAGLISGWRSRTMR